MFVFRFVFSDFLQVRNILITVIAFHFSSSTIHGSQGFSKVAVMKQAVLKACNHTFHGRLEPPDAANRQ